MIGVILYHNFAAFEIILATYILQTKYEIVSFGRDDKIESMEKLFYSPHYHFESLLDIDLEGIIIPGGPVKEGLPPTDLHMVTEKLKKMHKEGKPIGAICAGVELLKEADILQERQFVSNSLNPSLLTDEEKANFQETDSSSSSSSSSSSLWVDHNILTAKPEKYGAFAIEMGKLLQVYKDEADLEETISFFLQG